jgi:DNA-binding CsgD family transcriptional regulator
MLPIGKQIQFIDFTEKEAQVYNHICSGLTSKDIAKELNVSYRTIKFHLTSIFKKRKVKGIPALLATVIAEKNAQIAQLRSPNGH